MVEEPRTEETLYKNLRDRLIGKIDGLSNFTTNSFNQVWTNAFSNELREIEIRKLAAQLSGWVEYSGGDITQEDLIELGIEDFVTPEEVNQYMEDEDLDRLIDIVGINRNLGSNAVATTSTNSETFTYDSSKSSNSYCFKDVVYPSRDTSNPLVMLEEGNNGARGIIEVTGTYNGSSYTFEKGTHFEEVLYNEDSFKSVSEGRLRKGNIKENGTIDFYDENDDTSLTVKFTTDLTKSLGTDEVNVNPNTGEWRVNNTTVESFSSVSQESLSKDDILENGTIEFYDDIDNTPLDVNFTKDLSSSLGTNEVNINKNTGEWRADESSDYTVTYESNDDYTVTYESDDDVRKNAIDWSTGITNDNAVPDDGTDFEVRYETNGNMLLASVTSGNIPVPNETSFGTLPDNDGEFLEYETTQEFESLPNANYVFLEVESVDVGTEYNIGANSITYLPSPPVQVTGVIHPYATFGGEPRESNEELRQRAKNALVESSGGGTTAGIEGYITENTEARFAEVDEYYDGENSSEIEGINFDNVPYGEVIVEGGETDVVEQAIDDSRPGAVQHVLVRPTRYALKIEGTLEGFDVDDTRVEERIQRYIRNLDIGENLYKDQIVQRIMNTDEDIINVSNLKITMYETTGNTDNSSSFGEVHTFESGKFDYSLDLVDSENPLAEPGIEEVTYDNGNSTLTEGTDYDEDTDADGNPILTFDMDNNSSADGTTPLDGNDFYVRYAIKEDVVVPNRGKLVDESINFTVSQP
jgi:hypothetical protein